RFNLKGLEDCRIFSVNKEVWFTCTSFDTNPTGQPQISLCKLAEERESKIINVEKLLPLQGPDLNRCEKNWLPFVNNDQLYTIYSYDPFIIYKPDFETGNCETAFSY